MTTVLHDQPVHGFSCDVCGQWEVGPEGVLEPRTWLGEVDTDEHLCPRCLLAEDGVGALAALEARANHARARSRELRDEFRAVRAQASQALRAREAHSTLAVTLPAVPDSIGLARRLACTFAPAADADDLALLTSELVTNAVQHSGLGPDAMMSLRIRLGGRHVTVSLRDSGPGVASAPYRGRYDSSHGRGLGIIEGLACAWGSEPGMVWFAL